MTTKPIWLPMIVISTLVTQPVYAQDQEASDRQTDAEHCVSLNWIDRTEVVDDRNILFYMKGDKIYRNFLPHRCPGLAREEAFMYRTSIGQLCDLDIITVLNNLSFGFTSGVSCGLGMFYPITEDEIKALKKQRSK